MRDHIRADVVGLLTAVTINTTDPTAPWGEMFRHRDGRPLTAAERDLIVTATAEEIAAAQRTLLTIADHQAEQAATWERIAEIAQPYAEAHPDTRMGDLVPLMTEDDRAEFLTIMERVAPDGTVVLARPEDGR